MIGRSLHIDWTELACKDKDKTPYPSEYVADGRVIELVVMFEKIRTHFGSKPLIINSAYRTVPYNKSVGGAPDSQHLIGRALDIQPPKGLRVNEFYLELFQNSEFFGIKGLGKYKTFCHCDIRLTDKLVTWDLSNE